MNDHASARVIEFSCHDNPFVMESSICENPDCECTSIGLTFIEIPKRKKTRQGGYSFHIDLDVETWKEIDAPERTDKTARLVAEFLHDLTEEMKSEFRTEIDEIRIYKRRLRRLAEYRLPPEEIEEGLLVSYGNINAWCEGDAPRGTVFSFRFSHEGSEFLAADLYCPRPSCKCNEVHLMIVERKGNAKKPVIKERAMAVVSLKGAISIQETFRGTEREAEELAAKWRESEPDVLELFNRRYREIKKIGKRSLAGRRIAHDTRKTRIEKEVHEERCTGPVKAGRNDPCPCGSGKKYKKCCG